MAIDTFRVKAGGPVVDPVTFAQMVPVTIYIPLEAIHELKSVYALDMKTELAAMVGQDIVEFLEKI